MRLGGGGPGFAALREEAAQEKPADAIISSLVAGVDIAELDRPQAETRAKIEGANPNCRRGVERVHQLSKRSHRAKMRSIGLNDAFATA